MVRQNFTSEMTDLRRERPYAQFWRSVKPEQGALSAWRDGQAEAEPAIASQVYELPPSHWDYVIPRVADLLLGEADKQALRKALHRALPLLLQTFRYYTHLSTLADIHGAAQGHRGSRYQRMLPLLVRTRLMEAGAMSAAAAVGVAGAHASVGIAGSAASRRQRRVTSLAALWVHSDTAGLGANVEEVPAVSSVPYETNVVTSSGGIVRTTHKGGTGRHFSCRGLVLEDDVLEQQGHAESEPELELKLEPELESKPEPQSEPQSEDAGVDSVDETMGGGDDGVSGCSDIDRTSDSDGDSGSEVSAEVGIEAERLEAEHAVEARLRLQAEEQVEPESTGFSTVPVDRPEWLITLGQVRVLAIDCRLLCHNHRHRCSLADLGRLFWCAPPATPP
jgi:hypothetical protein